jgi:hypothetical protein
MLVDLSDTAHTPSTLTEVFESTTNSWTLAWGTLVADATSETAGWTGGTNCTGLAIALIPAAEAGGVEVVVPLATLSISGQVPLVGTGKIVNAPLATISLTGQVPAVGTGSLVSVPVALISITGLAPGVTGGTGIVVPLDEVSIAGFEPGIATGKTVAVPLDQIMMAGQVPIITATPLVNIAVPVDEIQIIGNRPLVITSFTLAKNIQYEVYILNPNKVRWEHTRIVFTGNDFGPVQ